MRMDDPVSITSLDRRAHVRNDLEASTRILCQLTADGIECGTPWRTDVSIASTCHEEADHVALIDR